MTKKQLVLHLEQMLSNMQNVTPTAFNYILVREDLQTLLEKDKEQAEMSNQLNLLSMTFDGESHTKFQEFN